MGATQEISTNLLTTSRFLPNVHDRGKQDIGVYCTRWEGWKSRNDLKIKITFMGHPKRLSELRRNSMRVPMGSGIYALLYYPSNCDASNPYVLYIGVAGKNLMKESQQTSKRFANIWDDSKIGVVYAATKETKQADIWEYFLIRHYCPPWNTRFSKQPRNPEAA